MIEYDKNLTIGEVQMEERMKRDGAKQLLKYDPSEDTHAGTIGISGIDSPREKLADLVRQVRKLFNLLKRFTGRK